MTNPSQNQNQQGDASQNGGVLKSVLFGRGVFGNSIANVTGEVDGAPKRGERIMAAWAAVRKAYAPKKVLVRETFEEAVARQGLTDERLAIQAQSLRNASRGAYLCAGLMFLILLYSAATSDSVLRVMAVAVLFFFCMVQGWIRAFRHWQIRNRKLGGLRDFTQKAEDWIV